MGGIRAGLRWIGKADNVGDALRTERTLFDDAKNTIPEFIGPLLPETAEMQQKILWGQRKLTADGIPSNGIIGAHSGKIGDNFARLCYSSFT